MKKEKSRNEVIQSILDAPIKSAGVALTVTNKFTTDVFGGKMHQPGSAAVMNWLKDQCKRLLHPDIKKLKDALENEDKLKQLLKDFNVDEKGYPVIGNWMLLECSIDAQKLAGTWDKYKVSADRWRTMVSFSPNLCNLHNGNIIKKPDNIYFCGVKPKEKKKPAFFTAYQSIKKGCTITYKISFPSDLCIKVEKVGGEKQIIPDLENSVSCVKDVVYKMGVIGMGPYRVRFGKSEVQQISLV